MFTGFNGSIRHSKTVWRWLDTNLNTSKTLVPAGAQLHRLSTTQTSQHFRRNQHTVFQNHSSALITSYQWNESTKYGLHKGDDTGLYKGIVYVSLNAKKRH